MVESRWTVHVWASRVPEPRARAAGLERLASSFEGVPEGTPFLLSPSWEYDVALNGFFVGARMAGAAANTRMGYARDVAAFLSFLWSARGGRSWRDATEDDHVAYLVWRRRDEAGPRVSGATWNREVTAVNEFYRWAVAHGHVASGPVPSRPRSPGWVPGGGRGRSGSGPVPATLARDAARERVSWLPPVAYRRWRDVGLRGYGVSGVPDPGFRGRWASRNALFADLMVRTGLRLSEQAWLSVFEVPGGSGTGSLTAGGYGRFWLPEALAKGASARWVYVPGSLGGELEVYRRFDRREVVERARAAGRYRRGPDVFVVEDPAAAVVRAVGPGGPVPLSALGPAQRRRLLVDTGSGVEPAAFWLGEDGDPVAVSTWKSVFAAANERCAKAGAGVRAHPHQLRHSFAVVTLEQLQRGHIAALSQLDPAVRGQYARVFGDPLDWVRRRLGHRSVVTTSVYLHALSELEMATRMALVPDTWEDPRVMPATWLVGEEHELGAGR